MRVITTTLLTLVITAATVATQDSSQDTLDIYVIDVEGGEATLFVSPSGESMLVDAGWPGFDGRDADRIAAADLPEGVVDGLAPARLRPARGPARAAARNFCARHRATPPLRAPAGRRCPPPAPFWRWCGASPSALGRRSTGGGRKARRSAQRVTSYTWQCGSGSFVDGTRSSVLR